MKILLVDDHPLFLKGLQFLLESYKISVLGTVNNGKDAISQARHLKPDIILMDIQMPEFSGIETLKLIKAEMPEIRIIMLTASEEDDDLFDAIKYGASGYLIKNTDADELVEALYSLEKGEVLLSPGLAEKLLNEFSEAEQEDSDNLNKDGSTLTPRQMEVLELVAQGLTYEDAGDQLGLSRRTVKYHMEKIIETLQMENRAQVIAYAARIGLVEDQKKK
ncbi:response regulator transcription factor [Eubacteriaceae bacterium ES2]|nr:response regulator transcription factor [Eubacteriaceae bacterium ES2]